MQLIEKLHELLKKTKKNWDRWSTIALPAYIKPTLLSEKTLKIGIGGCSSPIYICVNCACMLKVWECREKQSVRDTSI